MCQMLLFAIFCHFCWYYFKAWLYFSMLSSLLIWDWPQQHCPLRLCFAYKLLSFSKLCGLLQANFSVLFCFWPAIQLNLAGERSVFSQIYANLCHIHSNFSWNISSLLLPHSLLLHLVIIIMVTNALHLFLPSLLSSQPHSMGNSSEGE